MILNVAVLNEVKNSEVAALRAIIAVLNSAIVALSLRGGGLKLKVAVHTKLRPDIVAGLLGASHFSSIEGDFLERNLVSDLGNYRSELEQ
jgi:hypothetical protein